MPTPSHHQEHLPTYFSDEDATATRKVRGCVVVTAGTHADPDEFYYRGVRVTRDTCVPRGTYGYLMCGVRGGKYSPDTLKEAREIIDLALEKK